MKKIIFIIWLLSSNSFADTKSECTENDIGRFALNAHNEIIAKTYYPKEAQIKGFEGEGIVIVLFDEVWNIKNIKLLQSTNLESLDIAMIDIIKTSNYPKPNCSLEEHIELEVPFRFKLRYNEDN